MIAATIFLCAFVILGGVVYYLSQTIDAGEARFDSETGKLKQDKQPGEDGPARPAQRLTERIETTDED